MEHEPYQLTEDQWQKMYDKIDRHRSTCRYRPGIISGKTPIIRIIPLFMFQVTEYRNIYNQICTEIWYICRYCGEAIRCWDQGIPSLFFTDTITDTITDTKSKTYDNMWFVPGSTPYLQ